MYLVENERIGLKQYTHEDDIDTLDCWKDIDTQKGYNGIYNRTLEDLRKIDISEFRFWVTVVDKGSGEKVGNLRLSKDEVCPDLAIMIYPQYRNQQYGSQSFALAADYLLDTIGLPEISAGCYADNFRSVRVLEKAGFRRYPEGDQMETNCFTGKDTVQMEFRRNREPLSKRTEREQKESSHGETEDCGL